MLSRVGSQSSKLEYEAMMPSFVYGGGLARGLVGNNTRYFLDGRLLEWNCFFQMSILTEAWIIPATSGYTSFHPKS